MIAEVAEVKQTAPPTDVHPLTGQDARIVPVKTVPVLWMHSAVIIPGTKPV